MTVFTFTATKPSSKNKLGKLKSTVGSHDGQSVVTLNMINVPPFPEL